MTSKLKCPFCGKKLFYDEQDGIYRCMKHACDMDYEGGTEQLWQALIQTKQDLEITRKALKYKGLAIAGLIRLLRMNAPTFRELNDIERLYERILANIKQIEHKE